MRKLDRVTLAIADCRSVAQAIHSIKKSLSVVKPERVILFTSVNIASTDEYEVIQINPINSKEEYSAWIMRELYKYITTEFVWVAQWDSWALDANAWNDDFLSVDYIGSSWLETDGFAVGNGGSSIRSRKLMEVVATDPIIVSTHPEDNMICKVYRPYLESKYGFKWASVELADKFGFELKEPTQSTFTFHSFFHKPYQETVVIHRRAALGDVVHIEPVLHYFYKKGYKVVLDTLPEFFNLFIQHYFKVHHPEEIDARIMKKAKHVDLNLAYEITPQRLHLISYYEIAGILDGEIRNPKLTLAFDHKHPQAKLFRKYVVLHIDERIQKGRNIYGVAWGQIVLDLYKDGYTVVQIGRGEHKVISGAVEMINMNEVMLMRLIGGADLFMGIDSGPANIAIAMGVKTIIFFGSVNPKYIIPDMTNVVAIQNHNEEKPICRCPHCWHSIIGTEGVECIEIKDGLRYKVQPIQGVECIETDLIPPCTMFTTEQVFDAINKITNNE